MMELLTRGLLAFALAAGVLALVNVRARRRAAPFEPALARLPLEVVGDVPGPLAAYVFTSRLCGACHETPALVERAAPGTPLVVLPVERYGALARRLGVDETPTLLLVDAQGRIRYASRGNPEADELRAYVWEARASAL